MSIDSENTSTAAAETPATKSPRKAKKAKSAKKARRLRRSPSQRQTARLRRPT
jgi:hypothetical protein